MAYAGDVAMIDRLTPYAHMLEKAKKPSSAHSWPVGKHARFQEYEMIYVL
jgi:hypothetical protein